MIHARLLADREVIPQAMKLNAAFFKTYLFGSAQYEEDPEECAGRAGCAGSLSGRADGDAVRPLLDYLREVGEARSATEIEAHFKRNFNVDGTSAACEYLADQGLIGSLDPGRI